MSIRAFGSGIRPTRAAIGRGKNVTAKKNCSCARRKQSSDIVPIAVISLVLSIRWLVQHLFSYPETLGLVMALQLLIGRYTGYRLTELFRFRDFLKPQSAY